MILNILFIAIGFILLVKGGDYLINGAVAIAQRAKLSPMVIGLTVIGFGTSAPELIVSVQAALAGAPGLAIGNAVGSNIANIALILGVTALICPIPSHRSTMRIDMPFMMLAMCLFVGAAMLGTGTLERWQGALGVLMIVSFVAWQVVNSRKQTKAMEQSDEAQSAQKQPMPIWKALIIVVCSIAAMVWGASLLIDGASAIALELGTMFGIDAKTMERIIGLTIVAIGTSLPELFASVIAARKGETDMAIGNIIGSNTFNILAVIGTASAICPMPNCNVGFLFDYGFMIFLGALLWLFLHSKHLLERWEGGVLLALYILYIAKTIVIVG